MSTTQDSVMRGAKASKGNGSPGQGPNSHKKFIFKKNKTKYAPNPNLTNKSNKSKNTAPTNRSFAQNSQNSLDHENDPDNLEIFPRNFDSQDYRSLFYLFYFSNLSLVHIYFCFF